MNIDKPNGNENTPRRAVVIALIAALITAGMSIHTPTLRADDDDHDRDASRIRLGLQLAPVPLNVHGKDTALVGLGSYIVNAQASCNDCHGGAVPAQYLPGGNPYFGQRPLKINPATYLGGGRDFGPLTPGSPHIISRNLTPDKTGKPGGDTFSEFLETVRTGIDPDHIHPTCSGGLQVPCLAPPFDGELLQIMPWPVIRNMSNRDLLAIYEYLSAIPCVESGPGQPAHPCN